MKRLILFFTINDSCHPILTNSNKVVEDFRKAVIGHFQALYRRAIDNGATTRANIPISVNFASRNDITTDTEADITKAKVYGRVLNVEIYEANK